jgi:hypothetical protein
MLLKKPAEVHTARIVDKRACDVAKVCSLADAVWPQLLKYAAAITMQQSSGNLLLAPTLLLLPSHLDSSCTLSRLALLACWSSRHTAVGHLQQHNTMCQLTHVQQRAVA